MPASSTRRWTPRPTCCGSSAWEKRPPARLQRRRARRGIATLNAYLYEELGFSGNRDRYDDPRNSFLNEVLDRRLGIPISLAVVYLEIGRRAGLRLEGINFPGHFLVRAPRTRPGRGART